MSNTDYYIIGDLPLRWFDAQRWPKLIKLALILPVTLISMPWILFWWMIDMFQDLWKDL